MSIFGKIIGVVAKVATTAYSIIQTALPILRALRPAIDEVDRAFDYIEDKIADGGIAADDFLDKNIDTVQAIETWAGRGEAVMQRIGGLSAKLRIYSQEQTPDTITEGEAADLGEDLLELRKLIRSWGEETDQTIAKLEAMKA